MTTRPPTPEELARYVNTITVMTVMTAVAIDACITRLSSVTPRAHEHMDEVVALLEKITPAFVESVERCLRGAPNGSPPARRRAGGLARVRHLKLVWSNGVSVGDDDKEAGP